MFRPSSTRVGRRSPRRGAILLVVLTLLALFAVIGLAFVLYAESEANASRIARESVTNTNTTGLNAIDSTQAVNSFLGQFIYTNNDGNSALNGYDMARMIYGSTGNTVPYNGHGVYREPLSLPTLGNPAVDRTQVINFTPLRWSINATAGTETIVYVDPDRTNGNGTVRTAATPAAFLALTPPTHFVARNAAYTYPDRNNAYVAVQDPATGQIVLQSYHRGTLFNDAPALPYDLDSTNKNWMKPHGKFKILRPRTIDQLTLAEINYLQTLPTPLWPNAASAGANLNAGQYNQLATILTGNDAAANAAVPSFKTLFPYPPANPDGSITGDVQNMKFATGATQAQNYGMQRFDSVWLDAKLPTVTYKGKTLRPMVAATVLPMDGRVNLNVAGNLNGIPNGVNSTSGSHQGFGPHEINVGTVMALNPTDLQNMVTGRYGSGVVPNTRNSSNTQQAFHPDALNPLNAANANFQTLPPTYSQVNWNASGTYTPPAVPDYRSNPNYASTGTAYGNSDPTTEATSNPVMFNPYQWDYFTKGGTSTTFTKQLPTSDERRLQARYSDNTNFLINYSVLGSSLPAYAATNPNNPANVARAMLTPISNRNHRPGLAPNFFGTSNSTASANKALGSNLTYTPGVTPPFKYTNSDASVTPTPPTLDVTAAQLVDTTFGGGDTNVIAINAQIQNVRTALSGIDLNQPLPDYRINRPLYTSGVNIGQPDLTQVWPMNTATVTATQYNIATQARQAMAKAIFDRLCVATGARVEVINGVVTLPTVTTSVTPATYALRSLPVSKGEYDALRWLAQLAVNIVDYIDADDISTPFVWNPIDAYPYTASLSTTPTNELDFRAVFGVEKPRLVINEAYAEIANDQADRTAPAATKSFRVRFFVEMLNPGNTETNYHSALAGPTTADPNGSAPLKLPTNPPVPGTYSPISPYRLEVYTDSKTVQDELYPVISPYNVLGKPTTAPQLRVPLNSVTVVPGAPMALEERVEPNAGKFSADPTTQSRNGFAFIGPLLNPAQDDTKAFIPNTTAPALYNMMLQKMTPTGSPTPTPPNSDQLEYMIPKVPESQITTPTIANLSPNGNGHAILLQRLACPYLIESPSNPYVTVDYMTHVTVHDAIRVGDVPSPVHMETPKDKRWSVGRVQPFGGYQNYALMASQLDPLLTAPALKTFADTLVVGQKPTTPVEPGTTELVTFFRMNSRLGSSTNIPSLTNPPTPAAAVSLYAVGGNGIGTDGKPETLLAPFEWLTHLDRKLISPMEVLHVGASRPFELTHKFATPGGGTATPKYHQHTLAIAAIGTSTLGQTNPLYRIMEMLQPKPWTYGIAAGSRIPGGININMLWDGGTGRSKVFEALMDKQPVNDFTNTGANNDLTTIWDGLKATRSPGWTGVPPVVGVTKDEILDAATNMPGADSPFKGLGVANFIINAGVLSQTDVNSTILRLRPSDNKTLFSRYTSATPPAVTPGSYADLEPLRKAYNNITTVSDTYMVVFTIGYFEVIEEPTTGKTLLRREAFNQVPGDLRSQFSAIIDRSALGVGVQVDTTGVNTIATGNTSATAFAGRPWFTEVASEVLPASAANGSTLSSTGVNTVATSAGYSRFYFRFLASGTDVNGNIVVNYEGQPITFVPQTPPTPLPSPPQPPQPQLRIGTGLNAKSVYFVGRGYVDSVASVNLPAFDPATGLATITFDWPTVSGTPQFQIGSAMSGMVIPGNPGAQPGFDYTQYKYKSVVRDFGMLRPNP